MYSAISANKRNTILIMIVFLLILSGLGWLVGYYFGDYQITAIMIAVATGYALIQYFAASRMAVAMSGGREISKQDYPELWRVVENLSIASGLPMPRVFVIDDPAPNAFATGRDPKHAYVAATTGLLAIMDKRELEAVMAHEISHVKNYDIRVSMIVFGLVAAIGLLADIVAHIAYFGGNKDRENQNPIILIFGLVAAFVAPFIAGLVQLAVSRQREYLADSSGALLTRDPEGLASALQKLNDYAQPMQRQNSAMAHFYISNPSAKNFVGNLFSTHPPIDKRIDRLMNNRDRM